jgi:integrase
VLSDREVVWLWRASDRLAPQFGAAVKVLLLTGARLAEVSSMRRDELTEDAAWVIPAERAKNHRKHVLHLAPLAREALASAPRVEGPFVFTTNGRSPISGWSKAKSALDAAMLQVAREEAEAEGRDPDKVLAPFRLHDLRRTAASGMQRLGTRVEVVELCLNHVSGSYAGITGTYQRDPMLDERRAAMQRWSAHVAGLVSGKAANIVPMPRKRKGA